MKSLRTDLLADGIFLLVKSLLFGLRDVATAQLGVKLLLLKDGAVLRVQPARLRGCQFALFPLLSDAVVLILQAVDDLVPARMV